MKIKNTQFVAINAYPKKTNADLILVRIETAQIVYKNIFPPRWPINENKTHIFFQITRRWFAKIVFAIFFLAHSILSRSVFVCAVCLLLKDISLDRKPYIHTKKKLFNCVYIRLAQHKVSCLQKIYIYVYWRLF